MSAEFFLCEKALVSVAQLAIEEIGIGNGAGYRAAPKPDRKTGQGVPAHPGDDKHSEDVQENARSGAPCDHCILLAMEAREILAIRCIEPDDLPHTQRFVRKGRDVFILAHTCGHKLERLFPGKSASPFRCG